MVGFNHFITFNNNGRITDYQRNYTKDYAKQVHIYLPPNFNNKKQYNAVFSVAVLDTYPKQILTVEGEKSDTDLNKYTFDLTNLYLQLKSQNKLGLCRVKLTSDNGRTKFESESFRIQ